MCDTTIKSCFICRIHLSPPYIQCEECFQCLDEYTLTLDGHVNGAVNSQRNRQSRFEVGNREEISNNSNNSNIMETDSMGGGDDSDSSICSHVVASQSTTPDEEIQTLLGRAAPVHICVLCFRRGEAKEPHQSDHSYSVVRSDFPIFSKSSWSAAEELKLVTSVKEYGIGNWREISRALPGKSARDCEKHFCNFYIDGQSYGMPECKSALLWTHSAYSAPQPHVITSEPPRPSVNSMAATNMAGYMAARGDFTTEYDNHAELAVSNIHFDTDDFIEETEMKLGVVQTYLGRVREREKRKSIIRKFGLIHPSKTELYFKGIQKQLSPGLISTLKRCMRLMEPINFDYMIESLRVEVQLRNSIKHLQEYRREGLTQNIHKRVFDKLKISRSEVKEKRTALTEVMNNLQNEETWNKWIQKSSVAKEIAKGGPVPLPNLARRSAPPLDIEGMVGVEKLSEAEKELCSKVRLLPTAYINFRDILMSEFKKEGKLRLAKARTLIKIDVNKTRKIFDFLLSQQMISKGD